MMRFVRTLATALVAISMAAGSAHAQTEAAPEAEIVLAQAKSKQGAPRARHTGTHVYLLRGFMDVFSTGMNELGTKLNRQGIRATVHNHSEFQSLANAIGERHRQGIRENVVIIGHSLGANDAFRMAERLNDFKINVPLIIAYDPTATMSAGSNVQRVVNFYSSTNGWGVAIARGPGFRGSLSNVDLSRRGEMGHTDIDKSPALHAQSINYVRSIGGSRRATTETASPAPRKAPEEKESAAKAESKTAEAESKPAESKTADADAKPAESKTAEADAKPAESKTAEADAKKSDEQKTADKDSGATKEASAETTASVNPDKKPSAESKPAAAEASAAKITDKPAESKPAESKSASEKPAEPKAADTKSAENTAEAKPAADKTETAASSEKKESTSN